MDRRVFLQRTYGSKRTAARDQSDPEFSETPSLEPYDGPWDRAAIAHLLRRATIAPTFAEMRAAESMTMNELVEALTSTDIPLPAPPRFVAECMNASALYWDSGRSDIIATFFEELRRWWLQLMVNGGLSARERMTLFWHNHFSNNARAIQDSRFLYLQNQMFRRLALGNFKGLVREITIDKSMLLFLDGKFNKNGSVNENYARELQELFTIGIADNDGNPNYTQEDVVEAARTLTGWDWVGFGMQGDVSNNLLTGHDATGKNFYGEAITGSTEGSTELSRLLDIIFAREQTARYVIRKLYRFLVYTDATLTPVRKIPTEIEEKIITPLAEEFRSSGWDISVVLRRLFRSRHFYDPAIRGAMIKSPVDHLVSAIRGTVVGTLNGSTAEFGTQYAQERATTLGQNLFHPPGVQGWQFYRSWISSTTLPQRQFYTDELLYGAEATITDRLNLILNGPIPRSGTWKIDALAFARQFSSFDDPETFVRDMAEHLLAFPASARLIDRLLKELVGDRAYEWPDLSEEIRTTRVQATLRTLMRSTNFQLM